MICRLSHEKRELALTDAKALMKECKKINCSYFLSSLDSDDLSSGCTLLVAGLLAAKKEENITPTAPDPNSRAGKVNKEFESGSSG